MLTLENTPGFDQETLDKMNFEVCAIMGFPEIEDYDNRCGYMGHILMWAGEEVLKRYGGV